MWTLLAFLTPGPPEMIIILVIAVLLFGKRLPEVARSLGRSMVEFKKGVRGLEDEFRSVTDVSAVESPAQDLTEEREEATAPKFEPPAAQPKPETGDAPRDAGAPREADAQREAQAGVES